MLLFLSNTTNPAFNLAAEEWFFKNLKENIIFLYKNSSAVIIGKHQNALREINLRYLREHKIPIFRRLSGGGTVYHDPGNINFCFIKNGTEGNLINFKEFTAPIIQILINHGIKASLGTKNEILADGLKVSGNAEHIVKTRVLHHGTLLFDTDLKRLEMAISGDESQFADKAVRSNRSSVQNLNHYFPELNSADDFLMLIKSQLFLCFPDLEEMNLLPAAEEAITELAASKYSNEDWTYGYSPDYQFTKTSILNNFAFEIQLSVSKSMISSITIKTPYPEDEILAIAKALKGIKHHPEKLLQALNKTAYLTIWSFTSREAFCEMLY